MYVCVVICLETHKYQYTDNIKTVRLDNVHLRLPILKTNKNTLSLLKEITLVKHIKIHITHTEHY